MTRKSKLEPIVVRAVRTRQGNNVDVFAFFLPGPAVLQMADIARVHRDDDGGALQGFQRPEIRSHVKQIADFLDHGPVLFPNAIILALSPEIEFRGSRGPAPEGLIEVAQAGTLTIPVRPEGERAAWIVDGQQRSLALARTKNHDIVVPVIGFVSADIETHREQFILVNKAKPLPARLINELLPETSAFLPRDLSVRRIPSELVNWLNRRPGSPFRGLVRRISDGDENKGVVVDSALISAIKGSLNSPLGALSPHKGGGSPPDLEAMYQQLVAFWGAAREAFPDAWNLPPTRSRLMHSAGIQAMGYLMDRLLARTQGAGDQPKAVLAALRAIRPRCAWTEGSWEGLGLAWDEVQSVPRHIRGLADLLIRLDYEASRGAAA
ncbi:MAG: DGQHR domain-containing protein [Acetobacteraceae bacterium]|nr:DGQHR domain-containing protein [Acetobacteraceae bacterium]